MSRLEHAAIDVHLALWHRVGPTDDWPVRLAIDKEIYNEVVNAFNELDTAVEEFIKHEEFMNSRAHAQPL